MYQLLSDIVLTPDIIAITKLNNNSNYYNDIQLPEYTFIKFVIPSRLYREYVDNTSQWRHHTRAYVMRFAV